jgi:hypothetical protein
VVVALSGLLWSVSALAQSPANPPAGSVWTYGTAGAAWAPGFLNQASTTSYWVDNNPPVNLNRMNDRLFLGASANTYNASFAAPVHSWTGTVYGNIFQYLETFAQLSVISTVGEVGGFYASRTSETLSGNTCCSIPLAIFGNNDRTGRQDVQWGLYSTLTRQPGAGTVINEFDIGNLGNTVVLSPYSGTLSGATSDLWVACGGEAARTGSVNPCSAAMTILDNGSTFNKGIVFVNTALGADGAVATAIDLARRQQIVWETPTGIGALIRSDVTDSTVYGTSSLLFTGGSGSAVAQFLLSGLLSVQMQVQSGGTDGNPNYIILASSKTGVNPALAVAGTAANIGLVLNPKGTGQVVIGGVSGVNIAGMPATCTGMPGGTLWNSAGTVHICP